MSKKYAQDWVELLKLHLLHGWVTIVLNVNADIENATYAHLDDAKST
jgi:hypothetical protein